MFVSKRKTKEIEKWRSVDEEKKRKNNYSL